MTVYESPWGKIQNPYYGNLASFILENKYWKENPSKTIYVDASTGESLKVSQVTQFSLKLNYLLKNTYHIYVDDVVNIFSPNSIYTPAIHYGILARGAIVSPANAAYTPSDLHHQLKICGAKMAIVNEGLKPTMDKALEMGGLKIEHVVLFNDLVNQVNNAEEIEQIFELGDRQAVYKDAYYCCSSGTSGVPKAVMTTHYNMAVNVLQQRQSNPDSFTDSSIFAGIIPMSHIFGLAKFTYSCPFATGLTVVFSKFDFELFLQSILKYKISTCHIVPPIVVLLAKSPLVDKYDIGDSLKNIFCGAAPLGREVIDAVEERLGASVEVTQGYGLTETSPVTHSPFWDKEVYSPDSIGWLLPGCSARLVNERGEDIATGHRGELWFKGPQVMKGYLKEPAANKAAFTDDGYFKTGDIAVIDRTGQFYIVDRLKELIKSKGHQVAPAELEALLLSHPDIIDCAVVGVYNKEEATEYPRAYLVLRQGTQPQEILRWFNNKVARHKKLWGGIVVIDAIPKNPSGKILRRILRERAVDDTPTVTIGRESARL